VRAAHFQRFWQRSDAGISASASHKGQKTQQKQLAPKVNKDSSQHERAEAIEAIRKGMESIERGEGRPARKALEELQKELDIIKPIDTSDEHTALGRRTYRFGETNIPLWGDEHTALGRRICS